MNSYSTGLALKPVDLDQAAASLPIGAHLVGPRRFYLHHGIYLGGGQVVHYAGFSSSLRSGPIEVTDLQHFAHGKPVWMYEEQGKYSSAEIAARARSRIGEDRYRIFSNNCEHFCSWCIRGESYSAQLYAWLRCPRALLAFITALESNVTAWRCDL